MPPENSTIFSESIVDQFGITSKPYGYKNNSLPRLCSGGKFDPLFLRKDKSILHYYYPDELVSDLLSQNFNIIKFAAASPNSKNVGYCNDAFNIYVAGKKTKVFDVPPCG